MKIQNWLYNFLRKTQKYTGTDNVYLAKGGFWLTLGQAVSMLASILLALAFANLLDPTTYGNYRYVLSLIGMLGIFSLQGMRTAVNQAVSRGLEGSFYTGFKTRLKWGLMGSLAAIGLAAYYWHQGGETFVFPLLITAAFLPVMQASRIYSGFLAGRKLFDVGVKYNIATEIVSGGATVAVLLLTKNVFWMVAVYLVSHTFLNCLFDFLTKIKFKPNKKEDPRTINYAKHLSLTGVISLAGDYLDKILLFVLAGPVQLAVYSFAILIPKQIQGAAANISIMAFPKLAAQSSKEIKKNLMKKFWKLAILMGLTMALYIAAAPFLYKIFFPRYLDSITYSQVFIFSLIAVPGSLLNAVFQAKMMKKNIYITRFFSLLRLILFIILVPIWGIWGLISARVIMSVLNLFLSLFLFKRL